MNRDKLDALFDVYYELDCLNIYYVSVTSIVLFTLLYSANSDHNSASFVPITLNNIIRVY